ncbi:MAG: DUF418 domain-containing protein [Akkermansia sp.]
MNRIFLLDSLRALALLGIVIVHSHDHFNFYVYPPDTGGWILHANFIATWIYENLFVSKSFLLFSFLFGVSFFIQLDRSEKRGVDFRARFIWRLMLLFLLGLVHTLFYDGDILTIFGILGVILVPLYKLPKWFLLTLSGLLLVNIPSLIEFLTSLHTGPQIHHPIFSYDWETTGSTREQVDAGGSWLHVALWNMTYGLSGKWKFFIESGRIWQTLGLFVLGVWAGRQRLFEQIEVNKRLLIQILLMGSLLSLICIGLQMYHSALPQHLIDPSNALLTTWGSLAYFASFVAFISLLSMWRPASRLLFLLAPIGKVTLTCYISQSIVFTFIYFGWGLGLASHWGAFISVISAILLFMIQGVICTIWLKYFKYGPLEWLWRSGTQCKWQPMRLKDQEPTPLQNHSPVSPKGN